MALHEESVYEIKARFVSALANPKRLEIVDLLSEDDRSVSDLAARLRLPQATTSQHLAILRKAGVVLGERRGGHVFYRLTDPRIATVCGTMTETVFRWLQAQHEKLRPVVRRAVG